MPISGGNFQSQPDFALNGGKGGEGGGDNFQGEGLDFSRTFTPRPPKVTPRGGTTRSSTHSWGEVGGRNHTKWANIEVCATTPHFVPDRTERLLSPRTASTPRTQKAADGGQNPLESKDESEWTKQRKNCKIPEREQPTRHRVNALWCGNNSPSTAHFSPENRLHNKLTQK